MAIINKGSQEFQPYARLINIIGDQLITNKIVAIMEIIKNSYDADATNVNIKFLNKESKNNSTIIIEDDGDGMDLDKILNVWLKPATPQKLEKKKGDLRFTRKGRIVQGEKGIGRFAIHKIGELIELFTKTINTDEIKLELDYKEYDPEENFLYGSKTKKRYKLLSDIKNNWYANRPPLQIITQGTYIKISELREEWSNNDLDNLQKALNNFLPPSIISEGTPMQKDFNVQIYDNEIKYDSGRDKITFNDLYLRAPYRIEGYIDEYSRLHFEYNSEKRKIPLKTINLFNNDYILKSIDSRFYENHGKGKNLIKKLIRKIPSLGRISFTFLAFDLTKRNHSSITEAIISFVKRNKIYVYRDNIRVYPFGEQDFDWLELDKIRATIKAGSLFSYNDLIGFVKISQKENPLLKDASNRQGIVDINGSYTDFKSLLLAVLEIFKYESDKDKKLEELKTNEVWIKTVNKMNANFEEIIKSAEEIKDLKIIDKINAFKIKVQEYFDLMKKRMEIVEDLAGLGMAVEKASHDGIMILSKVLINISNYKKDITKLNTVETKKVINYLNEIEDSLFFIQEELQIIQPLYMVTRTNVKELEIRIILNKVLKYFKRDLEDNINVKIDIINDFKIKSNEGMLLQVFINLFDNSIFWLNNKNIGKEKIIQIKVDGNKETIIFSDNGPGINSEIVPLIFQEFFSLKPVGRGLGLYIVKEILNRLLLDIEVIEDNNNKLLKGANFLIYKIK